MTSTDLPLSPDLDEPPVTGDKAAPVEPGEYPPVLAVDRGATLAAIAAARRAQDEAAARELVQVAHWADLHKVNLPVEVAQTALESQEPVEVSAAVTRPGVVSALGGPLLGTEGVLQLAGEGTFAVTEFSVCEVATTLGMSEPAARRFVAQTLELRDRLPRCWTQVQTGVLPAWKARQIAAETIALNAAAAAYVDAHLAPFAHKLSLTKILRTVTAAILRHDRPLAAARAAAAAEHRGVWLDDRLDGTTELNAVLDTPDAGAVNHTLNRVAAALGALGDPDSHQARRAKSLGILADPQYTLDLTTTAESMPLPALGTQGAATADVALPRRPRTWPGQAPTIHVHLHAAAVTGVGASTVTGTAGAVDPVAEITGYGPRTVAVVQQWLRDLAPGTTVKLTPVVDLASVLSTDTYHPTTAHRAQVTERDPCCVFPWCGRQGRYDLDHIIPFVPLDHGGPPGQTNTLNLARLCRFHHRVKTHGRWTYTRQTDGTFLWRSPHGRTYTVDRDGTTSLN